MMERRQFCSLLGTAVTLAACTSTAPRANAPAATNVFSSEQISVITRGNGPDIILIHGLASHSDVWAEAGNTLDERYRLHLVQIHGFAGVPRRSADSLIAAPAAREIARYIRETGLTRPALIGHSMGGTIALMVAAREPTVPGRVMVVDMVAFMGAVFGQPNGTVESLRPIAEQTRTQLLNRQADSANDMLTQMVAGMTRSDRMRPVLLNYARSSDRRTVAQAMYEIMLTDLRPELSRITVPLTVLYVIPPNVPLSPEQFSAVMQQIYSNAPNVRLVRIDESSHYIQLDQPARFVAEVERFMTDQKAR
jgi:pimeloyl-ACP methyl ester carboxylesterase